MLYSYKLIIRRLISEETIQKKQIKVVHTRAGTYLLIAANMAACPTAVTCRKSTLSISEHHSRSKSPGKEPHPMFDNLPNKHMEYQSVYFTFFLLPSLYYFIKEQTKLLLGSHW